MKRVLIQVIGSACIVAVIFVRSPKIGRAEGEIATKYVTYTDNNQANVNTMALEVSYPVTKTTKLTLSSTVDAITAASRKISIIDGVTGATPHAQSPRPEQRRDYAAGISQRIGEQTLSLLYDDSREDDYTSFSYFASWTSEFDHRNTAITLAYSRYDDTLYPFGVDWTDIKTSRIFDAAVTRVLSPRSQVRLTASYGLEDGYLSNPYHRIVINDFYYKERHPTLRDKIAAGAFYTLGFPGKRMASLQLDYRYYIDNWNVNSHTFGVKYNRYLTGGVTAFLRSRYYRQSGTFFFKEHYAAEEEYMTGDPKMGPLSSMLYGAGCSFEVTPSIMFDVFYEQYQHTADFDYSSFYSSVAKDDLTSHVLYVGTRLKF